MFSKPWFGYMAMSWQIVTALFFLTMTGTAMAQTAIAPAGSGTAGNPYQIATLENLYWIAAPDGTPGVTPNRVARWAAHSIQTADIDGT
jgi:hypothetical protein